MNVNDIPVLSLEKSPGRLVFQIRFPRDSGLFDGHFPGFPLLPGVVQAHFAIRLFEKETGTRIVFSGIRNMKFFTPIFPGTTVQLTCEHRLEANQLSFQYQSWEGDSNSTPDPKIYSKGTIELNVQ